ncbi:MAG: polysaccharide deacetylase family protein [Bacteroidota bacterium]
MKIILYASRPSKRLYYVVDFLLAQMLHLDYELTDQVDQYQASPLPSINYGEKPLREQEVFLPAHALLQQKGIQAQSIRVFQHQGLPVFFEHRLPGADWPFDFFAMSFYLLSRYEEYLPFEADAHGRFAAAQSLAQRGGFLQQPLIDQWAYKLYELLRQKNPQLPPHQPRFRFQATIDIDMAWSYRHKGALRSGAALLRELSQLRLKELRQRLQVWTGQSPDPFFTFAYMAQLHQKLQFPPLYFWLLGAYGPYDKNTSPERPAFRQLIVQQSRHSRAGIHPSYRSNEEEHRVVQEKQLLEGIIGRAVRCSRQHYLMLRLPTTYRRLLAAGIEADYSMGYADDTGFRASTAQPFYWYDLEVEEATALRLYSFQAMDVTLQQYLALSPEAALERLQSLVEGCQEVGGEFVSLWHNSSFTEQPPWENWSAVYEQLIALGS